MSEAASLLSGEFSRSMDERYRVTLPPELLQGLCPDGGNQVVIAKERQGCLSLWNAAQWRERIQSGLDLIRQKIAAHRLEGSIGKVQLFGRLLSTRFRDLRLGDRGRVVLPEGFRDFLGVEPGGDVICVGAAICVELWRPERWRKYLEKRMPAFHLLFEELSR